MGNFKDMSDLCMAKDYIGAERFLDGSRPLMAETDFADIIVSRYNTNDNDERVLVGVYPTFDDSVSFYEGIAANKALGIEIGEKIAEYMKNEFSIDGFLSFFKSLKLSEIRVDIDESIPVTLMNDNEFTSIIGELIPNADNESLQALINYAATLDSDGTCSKTEFFKDTVIEFTLVKSQYNQEILQKLLDLYKTFTLNPFEIRGAAEHLRNGVSPEEIGQLIRDGKCDPTDGESLIPEEALNEFMKTADKNPAKEKKPSILEQINDYTTISKEPKKDNPQRNKHETDI